MDAATLKGRDPMSKFEKGPSSPNTLGPVYETHPGVNGFVKGGAGGNPWTVQKQSGVEV